MALSTHNAVIDLRPIDPYGRMTPSQELEYFIDRERQLRLFQGFLILLPDELAIQTAEFVKEQIKRASWHIDRAHILVNPKGTPSCTDFERNTWSQIDRERFSEARKAILGRQVRAVDMVEHQRFANMRTATLQDQVVGVDMVDHQRSVDTKTAILQAKVTDVDMARDNDPPKRLRIKQEKASRSLC